MLFTFSIEFFLGGVYICERKFSIRSPSLSLVPTLPPLTDILSVSFSPCELSPASPPPIVGSGEDFIGSTVGLSVVSVLLWKPTQKPWFETTVFYFAHRYKVSSAQPGLPLLDSL